MNADIKQTVSFVFKQFFAFGYLIALISGTYLFKQYDTALMILFLISLAFALVATYDLFFESPSKYIVKQLKKRQEK